MKDRRLFKSTLAAVMAFAVVSTATLPYIANNVATVSAITTTDANQALELKSVDNIKTTIERLTSADDGQASAIIKVGDEVNAPDGTVDVKVADGLKVYLVDATKKLSGKLIAVGSDGSTSTPHGTINVVTTIEEAITAINSEEQDVENQTQLATAVKGGFTNIVLKKDIVLDAATSNVIAGANLNIDLNGYTIMTAAGYVLGTEDTAYYHDSTDIASSRYEDGLPIAFTFDGSTEGKQLSDLQKFLGETYTGSNASGNALYVVVDATCDLSSENTATVTNSTGKIVNVLVQSGVTLKLPQYSSEFSQEATGSSELGTVYQVFTLAAGKSLSSADEANTGLAYTTGVGTNVIAASKVQYNTWNSTNGIVKAEADNNSKTHDYLKLTAGQELNYVINNTAATGTSKVVSSTEYKGEVGKPVDLGATVKAGDNQGYSYRIVEGDTGATVTGADGSGNLKFTSKQMGTNTLEVTQYGNDGVIYIYTYSIIIAENTVSTAADLKTAIEGGVEKVKLGADIDLATYDSVIAATAKSGTEIVLNGHTLTSADDAIVSSTNVTSGTLTLAAGKELNRAINDINTTVAKSEEVVLAVGSVKTLKSGTTDARYVDITNASESDTVKPANVSGAHVYQNGDATGGALFTQALSNKNITVPTGANNTTIYANAAGTVVVSVTTKNMVDNVASFVRTDYTVKINSTVTDQATLKEAIDNDLDTIQLAGSFSLSKPVYATKDLTIVLGENTLTNVNGAAVDAKNAKVTDGTITVKKGEDINDVIDELCTTETEQSVTLEEGDEDKVLISDASNVDVDKDNALGYDITVVEGSDNIELKTVAATSTTKPQITVTAKKVGTAKVKVSYTTKDTTNNNRVSYEKVTYTITVKVQAASIKTSGDIDKAANQDKVELMRLAKDVTVAEDLTVPVGTKIDLDNYKLSSSDEKDSVSKDDVKDGILTVTVPAGSDETEVNLSDYIKDLFNVVEVDSQSSLQAAVTADGGKTIKLTKDIVLDEKGIEIPAGATIVIDLNGYTITSANKNVLDGNDDTEKVQVTAGSETANLKDIIDGTTAEVTTTTEEVTTTAEGDVTTTAEGDVTTTAEGDVTTTAKGDVTTAKEEVTTTAKEEVTTTAKGDVTTAKEEVTTTAKGDVTTAKEEVTTTAKDDVTGDKLDAEIGTDDEGNKTAQLKADEDGEYPDDVQVTVNGKTLDPKFYSYDKETGTITFNTPIDDDADVAIYDADATTPANTSGTETPVEPDAGVRGDADGDGDVDAVDVLAVKKHVLKMVELDEDAVKRCDVVGDDGEAQANDLLLIKKFVLQMIDEL
jgi:hypothetical protein